MKTLTLQNLYTGGHIVKIVKDNYPAEVGQVVSFNESITDEDYKLYKVEKIKSESSEG